MNEKKRPPFNKVCRIRTKDGEEYEAKLRLILYMSDRNTIRDLRSIRSKSMGIYLGDLTIEQIESRLGIEFSAEDKEVLHNNYQARINKVPLEHGKWHCYDLPFMFMTHDKETALSYVRMFEKYNPKTFKQCLQVGYEDKEQEHD